MTTETTTEAEGVSTELALVNANPIAVITDEKRADEFLTKMRQHVRAHVPDVSTAKGREAIKSLAFKVTKSKTFLEASAKTLKEEAQKTVNTVNLSIRKIREDLDELARETRAPLTEWEGAEERRVARCKTIMDGLRAAAVIRVGDTADLVHAALDTVQLTVIDEAGFREFEPIASALKATAVQALIAALDRLKKEEAERAELDRLRAEAAERAARDEEERRAAEEKAWKEAEDERERQAQIAAEAFAALRAEEDRIAREEAAEAAAEAARVAAQRAADEARREAEAEAAEALKAEAERLAAIQHQRDLLHAQELAQAQRERDEVLAAQERERLERERQERAAHAIAEEQRRHDEARTADRAHRSDVMGAAKAALMESCKLSEATAKKIVLTICAGDVPHCSIKF